MPSFVITLVPARKDGFVQSILTIFFSRLNLLIVSMNRTPGSAVACAISTNLSHNNLAFTSLTTPFAGDTNGYGMLSLNACINASSMATDMFMFDRTPSTLLHSIKSMMSGWFIGISTIIAARLALPPDFVVAPTASYNDIKEIGPLLFPDGIILLSDLS